MAEKLTLRTINSLTNEQSALHAINDNYNDIANKIDTLVSRDGDIPNHMLADFDMNNNDILNVSTLEVDAIVIAGDGLLDSYYTSAETDDLLGIKSNIGHRHDFKTDVDNFPNQLSELNFIDFNLISLDDTKIVEPITDGFVLTYTDGTWQPKIAAGAGAGIDDAPSGANYVRTLLTWNEATLSSLSDATVTSAVLNDILIHDGTDFKNSQAYVKPTGIVDGLQYVMVDGVWTVDSLAAFDLEDTNDVTYDVGPTTGDVLEYQADGNWKPRTPSDTKPTDTTTGKVWGKGYTGSAWDWYEAEPRNTAILNHVGSTSNPHGTTFNNLVTTSVSTIDQSAGTTATLEILNSAGSLDFTRTNGISILSSLNSADEGAVIRLFDADVANGTIIYTSGSYISASDLVTAHEFNSENDAGSENLMVIRSNGNTHISGIMTSNNIVAGDLSWQTPALLNSWVNYDAGHASAQYRKHNTGVVEIKGLIRDGTTGQVEIMVLPVGYRPAQTRSFIVGDALGTTTRMQVNINGSILIINAAADVLIECSFYADGV